MKSEEFKWRFNLTKEKYIYYRTEGYEEFFTKGIGKKYVDTFKMTSQIKTEIINEIVFLIKNKNILEEFLPKWIINRIPNEWIDACTSISEKTRYQIKNDRIEWEIYPENPKYYRKLFCLNGEMYIKTNTKESEIIEIINTISFTIVKNNIWIPNKILESIEKSILTRIINEFTDMYKKLEIYIKTK